ncbi:MAG TPA: hypothetical protein VIS95_03950 [Solirubrobacterales bacterium]
MALAVTAALSLGVGVIASAVAFTAKVGNLIVTFEADGVPRKLPRNDYTPAATTISGKIKADDGTHPSALREVIVAIDKDVKLNVKGLPVCKAGELVARDTKGALKVCGDTELGSGIAHAEIAFPEQPPIVVASPLKIFNGGEKGGKIKLLIHSFITVPVPAAIVTDVTVTRKGSGIHSVGRIPVIAGGSGSAIDFRFKIGKTYSYKGKKVGYGEGKCPDGVFKVNVSKMLFKNETQVPGVPATTQVKGSVVVPCTPKG